MLIYFAPFIGAGLAYLFFAAAIAMQQDKGFFGLGLALGTPDAIIFALGALIALGTIGGWVWGFYTMT